MNRPAFVFLLWGLELAALTAVGVTIFDLEGPESPLLLGGAALTFVVLAAYIAVRGLGHGRAPESETVPDMSPATASLGLSLVLLALSTELGLWLALIAAGLIAMSLTGLARELRAQRRLRALSGQGEDQ